MCGRYHRSFGKQEIAEAYLNGELDELYDALELAPSYNVAPTTRQPVIRISKETGKREIAIMRWGLVPHWAKDGKMAYSTINAKAETIQTSGVFKNPFRKHRVLVPASGFYEWQKVDAKTKKPYSFGLSDDKQLAFAGVADSWKHPETGEWMETFSILTTEPNELTAAVHNRMPVILTPADYQRWLDCTEPERPPVDLLRPLPAEQMKMWPVHQDVGSVKNNRPDLCEPMNSV